MQEGGSLFVHLDAKPCPLCGALPEDQRHVDACDADIPTIVQAADAEIRKIEVLVAELDQTTASLERERILLTFQAEGESIRLSELKSELDQILTPNLDEAVGKFREIADKKSEVSQQIQLYRRLESLVTQRDELLFVEEVEASEAIQTDLSQSVIDEFAQEVHSTLQEWNFPWSAAPTFRHQGKRHCHRW